MKEKSVPVKGYEGIYEITESGRVISSKTQKVKVRCGDEYGFHIVKLSKNGESKNHNVFELWQDSFERKLENKMFKGALKAKYGKVCMLYKKQGIHFE